MAAQHPNTPREYILGYMFACSVEAHTKHIIRHKQARYEWKEKGISEVSYQ